MHGLKTFDPAQVMNKTVNKNTPRATAIFYLKF